MAFVFYYSYVNENGLEFYQALFNLQINELNTNDN